MIEKIINEKNKNTIKAITNICNRCLSKNLKVNFNNILYCEECYNYKRINETMYLERKPRKRQIKNHKLVLPFELSQTQLNGEKFINSCYISKTKGFLHAVCGAGKTEMCLKTIFQALQNYDSICFVIPRVEIIKQVYLRFIEYFPKTKIFALYKNQGFNETADIYLSTPQQLIRFYNEFDLVIVDEIDAYPFANNAFLQRLIKKAKKPTSALIYISATINKQYKKLIKNKKIKYLLIPKRYHNYDLVIPEFKKYKSLYDLKVIDFLKISLLRKQRLMIFFPSIYLMKKFSYHLDNHKIKSVYISSKSEYKKRIIKQYTNSEYKLLLTTTLLERGITFSNINVFVFEADHKIFTKVVLIQIAGRVGRDKLYPKGKLLFFSKFKTQAMVDCKQELRRLNKVKNNAM